MSAGSSAKTPAPIVCYVTDRKALGTGDVAVTAVSGAVRAAIQAGVDWVQIREKDLPGRQLLVLVRETVIEAGEVEKQGLAIARIYVNDRLDVALAAGAAGIHLGGDSVPVADVVSWRRSGNAPREFAIGVSCHSLESAREAEESGADYVFFGPIFDTPSKREFGPPQGPERLQQTCQALRVPVIAIGGINETNARDCVRAGAAGIAAIRLFQENAGLEKLETFIRTLKNPMR